MNYSYNNIINEKLMDNSCLKNSLRKNIRLSQYVKDRFSEWRVELARTLPSAQDLRGESLRDRFSGRSDGFLASLSVASDQRSSGNPAAVSIRISESASPCFSALQMLIFAAVGFLSPFGSKRPQVERQIRPNGVLHVARGGVRTREQALP